MQRLALFSLLLIVVLSSCVTGKLRYRKVEKATLTSEMVVKSRPSRHQEVIVVPDASPETIETEIAEEVVAEEHVEFMENSLDDHVLAEERIHYPAAIERIEPSDSSRILSNKVDEALRSEKNAKRSLLFASLFWVAFLIVILSAVALAYSSWDYLGLFLLTFLVMLIAMFTFWAFGLYFRGESKRSRYTTEKAERLNKISLILLIIESVMMGLVGLIGLTIHLIRARY